MQGFKAVRLFQRTGQLRLAHWEDIDLEQIRPFMTERSSSSCQASFLRAVESRFEMWAPNEAFLSSITFEYGDSSRCC